MSDVGDQMKQLRKHAMVVTEAIKRLDDYVGLLGIDSIEDLPTPEQMLEALCQEFGESYKHRWDNDLAELIDCAVMCGPSEGDRYGFLKTWANQMEEHATCPDEEMDQAMLERAAIVRRFVVELEKMESERTER